MEEVAAEGLVRNVPRGFPRSWTRRRCPTPSWWGMRRWPAIAVCPRRRIAAHFQILVDTLLGRWLRAYTRRPKRRVIAARKFYFADSRVVSHLARRGTVRRRSELFGKAFESWVFHEPCAHDAYAGTQARFAYCRLAGGTEVDFVVNDLGVAIGAKGTEEATADHLRRRRHRGAAGREFCRQLAAGDVL